MSNGADSYLESLGIEVGDELKHYGKKGMKWGVRNEDPSGSSGGLSRKEKRAAKNAEIEEARDRQRMRAVELDKQAFRTYTANGQKATEAAVRKYDKMQAELLTNPDAATAAKMTSGEKAALAVNWGLTAAVIIGAGAVKAATSRR